MQFGPPDGFAARDNVLEGTVSEEAKRCHGSAAGGVK